uniref:Plexin-A1 n=1 Tax=Cacopsylla melanoneura TaxID=428564 RepID=A0A8D9FIT0_9HEMI
MWSAEILLLLSISIAFTSSTLTGVQSTTDTFLANVSVIPNPIRLGEIDSIPFFHVTLENYFEKNLKIPFKSCCYFTIANETIWTDGTKQGKRSYLNCPKPIGLKDLILKHSKEYQKINVELSVRRTNESGNIGNCRSHDTELLATISIPVINCTAKTSCTECTSFLCSWCVNEHRCLNPKNNNYNGPNLSKIDSCPMIIGNHLGSSEIVVEFNTSIAIAVKVNNIYPFMKQTDYNFKCKFYIEGDIKTVKTTLIDDVISCDSMEFSYSSNVSNINASFVVLWGESELYNPNDVHVNIYNCQNFASNCGLCLILNEKYKCGWCQSSNSCETSDQCQSGNWTQTCSNPEITSFEPKSGLYAGGTNVTINGTNLGKTFKDIIECEVAGVPCRPYESLYKPSTQIVCQVDTEETITIGSNEGPVIVKIGGFKGISKDNYQFVVPYVKSIEPMQGSLSGNTNITINGSNLMAGSRMEVSICDLPCDVISKQPDLINCITGASNLEQNCKVHMKFDGVTRPCEDVVYKYVEDPVVDSVESDSEKWRNNCPRGTPAGGTNINVHGCNLHNVQKPIIYVTYKGKQYKCTCVVKTSILIICKSPVINLPFENLTKDYPQNLEYGFYMDQFSGFQNVTKKLNNSFMLFPDPKYEPFNKTIYRSNDYLTINGEYLDLGYDESDVTVMIGIGVCNVTSIAKKQLTCIPPSEQPPNSLDDNQTETTELPNVTVIVAKTLKFYIGKLSYSQPQPDSYLQSLYGSIAVIIALSLTSVAILIIYRCKSTKKTQVVKNLQRQMDFLEARVAAECKEAFAELQMEMTDLTRKLTTDGIPFRDYNSYVMNVLFPNNEHHGVLQFERPEVNHNKEQLSKFGELILNKTFFLMFIRTLESNPNFTMSDRVKVASLIMVVLQSKMQYCTDVLKTLLAELIEKFVHTKLDSKLLLRRTESVAEKMLSNWFSILLYKFLFDSAGKPLYLLFRAIKQQVEKGPVDAITGHARYSLSEDMLIRNVIDFKPMTVAVTIGRYQDVPVHVQDCDTISQVKEKSLDTIYRATPYSKRPADKDLVVEWQTENSGNLILNDFDGTNKAEEEWKQLKTLNHYKVPDGAHLTLRECNTSNPESKTANMNKMKRKSYSKIIDQKWHLVKQHDNPNHEKGERSNKMVSEVYLTRLLTTKGAVQQFVDDLFRKIFNSTNHGSAVPLAVKNMFDFLDKQELEHDITDAEVVHTWKSNALPLRFWVNLIKNPDFLFDIHKSNTLDTCLGVLAHTFMDSCSTSDPKFDQNLPSSDILYAKDIPAYKEKVQQYYSDIKSLPVISDEQLNAKLAEESELHESELSTNSALNELYKYATKYNEQLTLTLEEDEVSKMQGLGIRLMEVHSSMMASNDTTET